MAPSLASAAACIASSLIQKCTSITSLKAALQLHALMLTTFGTQTPYPNNNLISVYARCNSLSEARKVFDQMPQRNAVSYNALISTYSRIPSHANWAFQLASQMESEFLTPTGSTFTSLVQASAVLGDLLLGCALHCRILKLGFTDDLRVQTSILGMYSSCGDLGSAKRIFFGCVSEKDAVAWNSLIYGSLSNDRIEEGLEMFGEMLRSNIVPSQFTYSMVLNACSRLGDYSCGKMVHAQVIVSNVQADLPLQNALLDMYCSCGDIEVAFCVFGRIENPDLVSWNSMIMGYSENGYGDKAIDMFVKLQKMSNPKPDEYTYAAVISATGEFKASDYGRPLHGLATKVGYESCIFIGTTLVSMYFKNRDAESAQKVFNLIRERDVVLWTEMIMGHSRMGNGENSIQFFVQMCRERNKTDSFALSGALGACADLAILKQGEMIHSLAIKTGYEIDMSVCGSLVDMYGKNGDLVAAESIFSCVSNPDLKCWNSMLGAYSQHGIAEEALIFFEDILRHHLRPDEVTYLSLLSACSHSGLTQKGKFFWNHMKESALTPGPKHYSCMVSLLTRAGLLEEALEMIKESPHTEGHLELWRTLLSACVNTRNLRTGLYAAEQVLRLDSEDIATHILVSNLYAVTGKWDGVLEMRRKMRGLNFVKDPGLSWIEVKNRTQVFSSGGQSHSQVDGAQDELHRLKCNMIKSSVEEHDSTISHSQ